jgi:hypothetical protein
MRYRLTVIAAIIIISLMGAGSVVSISVYGTQGSTPLVTSLLGFLASIIVSFFTLLRSEKNAQLVHEQNARIEEVSKRVNQENQVVRIADREDIKNVIREGQAEHLKEAVKSAIQEQPINREQLLDVQQQLHSMKHALSNVNSVLDGLTSILASEQVKK